LARIPPLITFIEPGLPQRIVFTAEPMTCGMLWRCWIKWGVNKTPAYVIKQGLVKVKYVFGIIS